MHHRVQRDVRSFAVCLLCSALAVVFAQDSMARGGSGSTADVSLVLGRPTDRAVTLSILSPIAVEARVEYGTAPGAYVAKTAVRRAQAGVPLEVEIRPLIPNTRYYYHVVARDPGGGVFRSRAEGTFHTQRAPGSTFVFAVQGDSHPERVGKMFNAELYVQTLRNVAKDAPDFYFTMGDDFSIERLIERHTLAQAAVDQVYAYQRRFLGVVGRSTPILLALGTHDGESAKYDDGSDNCLAVWANRTRKRYFPNPVPDGFYTGNATAKPHCGLLQDYYAWEWGDALFVVLDPFWFSARQRGGRDGWQWSLGQSQYAWLKKTLEQSRTRFKFVFIHNLLCGDQAARGGVEVAAFNEWGGKNPDGTDGFKQHRPGWDAPLHQLLVHNHVAAVFKAHDNFYARQELDGILYLMVPQPSFAGSDRIRDLEAYGYKRGTFLCNSGHVRVTVSPDLVKVDYIRSGSPKSKADSGTHRLLADSYTIKPGAENK